MPPLVLIWFRDFVLPFLENKPQGFRRIIEGKLSYFLARKENLQFKGFPGGSDSKESACNAGDLDSIPGLGRSPGGGNCNLLQYSCLEHPHGERSLAGYNPWGRKELDATERSRAAHSRGCLVSTSHCCRWDQRSHQLPTASFIYLLQHGTLFPVFPSPFFAPIIVFYILPFSFRI